MSAPARPSIALRLAGLFAATALLGFALIGLVLHQVLEHELRRHQREELRSHMDAVRYMLVNSRSPELAAHARTRLASVSSAPDLRFWLWSEDPAFRYGRGAEAMAAATRGHSGLVRIGDPQALGIADAQPLSWQAIGQALPATPVRPPVQLIAAMDSAPFALTRRRFDIALALVTLAGTALVGALGYWTAKLGLRPVQRLSADAQRIGPHDRRRLDLPRLPRELEDLGASLNAAFDRLDAAYAQQESFNADVAHELRTPLASLIGQTQVALTRHRDAQQLRQVLQSNLEELERLRAIVADMLFLARAEQGQRARQCEDASLAEEVGKTVEFFEVLLDEAGLQVEVRGDVVVPVEKSLLRRALSNLLHNAIQHSAGHAPIVVEIVQRGGEALIAFSNPSVALAPEHLQRLFDRFYRGDAARANSRESHGLGLAIVKAVATMHGGRVFAQHRDGITTIGFSVALDGAATGVPAHAALRW
ncbi:heavy metal sensor histidine kinase [Xanthomonas sontii]|uniref:heavy metal sensor histidine kinase n=1 Tax=Xanthomonas sontii TaxID=2650745 RepID=UPI0011E3CF69|nr:heavy metal sensor histidine kinase [Xanthomonas sontii]MDQ7759664.1 heavy metal sensor histidine kinase [Xanthomonas sontii]TYD33534.1 two-component sensor histidine kinase [Xanthomonas sontii]UZK07659.1 heavy metal sensor histidine kinase [Xanthomonas sontii]